MADDDQALVMVSKCGCVSAAELSSRPSDVRAFYAEAAKSGREVRHMTVGEARAGLMASHYGRMSVEECEATRA